MSVLACQASQTIFFALRRLESAIKTLKHPKANQQAPTDAVIIINNASFHKRADMIQAIGSQKVRVECLP
jgi:hypothetical protein